MQLTSAVRRRWRLISRAVTAGTRGTATTRPNVIGRSPLLRRLAVPIVPLLVLAATLVSPTTAVADGSKYGDTRYHEWSWVTTHNSYADDWTQFPIPPNQSDTIQEQLNGGVRGLMLDTYDPKGVGPVALCHGGTALCYEDFKSALLTVVNFLQKNPQEVVTISLENYASRETLTKTIDDMLNAKNAGGLLFSPDKNMIYRNNWPRVRDMVSSGQRLVVFQDSWDTNVPVGSGALMYTWKHTVENKYGYGVSGRPSGCDSRNGTPLNTNPMPGTQLTPLFTMNQFNSDSADPGGAAPQDNGLALKNRIDKNCRPAAGRAPNFVAVNFYQNSDNANISPTSVVADLNRDAYYNRSHPAVWTVNASKQYVSAYAPNRCMVRGDEFADGTGGLVTQRACASPAPSSHQWSATKPSYEGKGYYWIKANNGSCLTVPYNNGTPPPDGQQMFWWPCETRWASGSQLWNIIPVKLDGNGRSGFYFINQWTGRCLTLDPSTVNDKGGKVTQAACPSH
ncbi:phosphatidylinositol-specific phospholipase C domain-containing protein [Streptomyces altiplanensis]